MLLRAAPGRAVTWALALVPVLGLGLLVALVVAVDPVARLGDAPAVEALVVERTVLEANRITMDVRNDGPGPVTIAQVVVEDAFRNHSADPRTVGRLGTARISIPYPWEEGVPLHVSLLTSTGVRIDHEIEAPVATPVFDAASVWDYAMVGIVIGVVPVVLGLLWLPALRRAGRTTVRFLLALTVGLLVFLLAETVAEGLELGRDAPSALRGSELFFLGFLSVIVLLAWLQMRGRGREDAGGERGLARFGAPGLGLAYLVALGIGLHNLGEGLAVGAAVAAGEVALGTALVLGFAVHNTTEGLAIAAPLSGSPGGGAAPTTPRFGHLVALAALAGVPTVLGAWGGAFVTTPAWSALAFGVAAGAIAQVAWSVGRSVVDGRRLSGAAALGFVTGLVVMYLTSLLVSA
jgi:zinc transporter ZupT